jgi:hypothetical protein
VEIRERNDVSLYDPFVELYPNQHGLYFWYLGTLFVQEITENISLK